jgi:transcriptional antiterminator RfaH
MNPTPPTDENTPAWYCVRTQPKREHLAAKGLQHLEGVETFCPRLRYKKATRRGNVWWVEAMFPGYIFAKFIRHEKERAVIHSQGVMTLLKFGSLVPAISTKFIEELQQLIHDQQTEEEHLLTLHPSVKKGDQVEIAHGAMQGITGEVIKVLPASERVMLLIDFLGNPQIVDSDIFSLILPEKPIPPNSLKGDAS